MFLFVKLLGNTRVQSISFQPAKQEDNGLINLRRQGLYTIYL